MIHIDGKMGEGGGQVLRASLALSLATGKPFVIDGIRGGRKKPGLLRQHYTAVKAAVEVGAADTSEVAVGATSLEFRPKALRGGEYQFSVGSAGSASLVMQAILPALLLADQPSQVQFEGGTHNPMAPPLDFVEHVLFPHLSAMGAGVSLDVDRFGFYPAGGGRFAIDVEPISRHEPLDLANRPETVTMSAVAYVSQIPESIAERELMVLTKALALPWASTKVVTVSDAIGPGNALVVTIEWDGMKEVITGFGEKGVAAERVAKSVVSRVKRFLKTEVPVGEHLADQLIVPMALGAGGRFQTLPPSKHLETVIDVTRLFVETDIDLNPTDDIAWEVVVTAA